MRVKPLQRLERIISYLHFVPSSDETMVVCKLEKNVEITYNLQNMKTKAMGTGTPQMHSKISIPCQLLFGVAKFRKNRNATMAISSRASVICQAAIASLLLWPS